MGRWIVLLRTKGGCKRAVATAVGGHAEDLRPTQPVADEDDAARCRARETRFGIVRIRGRNDCHGGRVAERGSHNVELALAQRLPRQQSTVGRYGWLPLVAGF